MSRRSLLGLSFVILTATLWGSLLNVTASCQGGAECPPLNDWPKGWQPKSTVAYCLSGLEASIEGADTQRIRQAAIRAFEMWNTANQANNSRVTFREVCNPRTTHINFRIGPANDKNGNPVSAAVDMAPQQWVRRHQYTKLAVITLDLKNQQRPPSSACVIGNPCIFFEPLWDNYYEFIERLIAHEIGHTMGLGNVRDKLGANPQERASIMNGHYAANDCIKSPNWAGCRGLLATNIQPCDTNTLNSNPKYPNPSSTGPGGTGGGGGGSEPGGGGVCSPFRPNLDTCYSICTGELSYWTGDGCGVAQGDWCAYLYKDVFQDGIVECEVTTRVKQMEMTLPDHAMVPMFFDGSVVSLKSSGGQFVQASGGGGGSVEATAGAPDGWAGFGLIDHNGGGLLDGDQVSFRAANGTYLQAVSGGGGPLQAVAPAIGSWETFTIINVTEPGDEIVGTDAVALRTSAGYYVVAEAGGGQVINANRVAIGSWETFTLHGGAQGGAPPSGGGGNGDGDLPSGEGLYPGQSVTSPNGQYVLVYQHDGNLVLEQGGTPVWGSGTEGTYAGVAVMQTDGNFVIYDGYGTPLRHSATFGNPAAHLKVQDDGNVVVYSSGGVPLWDRFSSGW